MDQGRIHRQMTLLLISRGSDHVRCYTIIIMEGSGAQSENAVVNNRHLAAMCRDRQGVLSGTEPGSHSAALVLLTKLQMEIVKRQQARKH